MSRCYLVHLLKRSLWIISRTGNWVLLTSSNRCSIIFLGKNRRYVRDIIRNYLILALTNSRRVWPKWTLQWCLTSGLLPLPFNTFWLDMLNCLFSNFLRVISKHCESFSRSSLAIHKYCAIYSLKTTKHNIFAAIEIDLIIAWLIVKALIY